MKLIKFSDFFGLQLAFTNQVLFDLQETFSIPIIKIEAKDTRLFNDHNDLVEYVNLKLKGYNIKSKEIILFLSNQRGAWFRIAALIKKAGFRYCIVVSHLKSNEDSVPKRVVIKIDEIKTIFVPNYKCGYSSFRGMCFDSFNEFKNINRNLSSSLNVFYDLKSKDAKEYLKISIVRNPLDRFRSFYRDKLCRSASHFNTKLFRLPFELFLNNSNFTPMDVLQVINKVPDNFSDPHWKGQFYNISFSGKPIVDLILKLETIEKDMENFSAKVGKQLCLFKKNITKTKKNIEIEKDYFDTKGFLSMMASRYKNDFDILGYEIPA